MKGISPMIASVLLIAFTVAIGGFFITWLSSTTSIQTTSVGSAGEKAAQCGTTTIVVKEVRYSTSSSRVNVTVIHSSGVEPLRNVSVTVTGGGISNSSDDSISSGVISKNVRYSSSDFKPGQSEAFSVTVTGGALIPPDLVTASAFCSTTYGLTADCKKGQSCMIAVS